MSKAYKLRFLPLAVTLPIYLAALALRRIWHVPLEGTEGYCALLVFGSLIFLLTVSMIERDRKKREQPVEAGAEINEPVKPEQNARLAEIEDARRLLVGRNIPIRIVWLLFSALVPLMGVSLMISNREIVFGAIILAAGLLLTLYSVLLLRRYFRRLKELKRMAENEKPD